MTEYRIYQIDAFTTDIFKGNPAAVVPLPDWPDDALLQAIAVENNLSETAFFTPADKGSGFIEGPEDPAADFHLRWFTPGAEVDLCGHATLAAAHVLFCELDWHRDSLRFSTEMAGDLTVTRGENGRLRLDFPARPGNKIAVLDDLVAALGAKPRDLRLARDHMAVLETESQVAAIAPNLDQLAEINKDGVMVTAPGDAPDVDFVSRFFAPNHGIPEDPVTGSAHCTLVPYWAERLGKTTLRARQISPRGGDLYCTHDPEAGRVYLEGNAVTYLRGSIFI